LSHGPSGKQLNAPAESGQTGVTIREMLMKPALDYPDTRLPLPAIRRIGATQPLRWLRAGWHDLKANPLPRWPTACSSPWPAT
jgi:uncharacterized membrane protein